MKKFFDISLFSFFPRHCAYCDKLIPGDMTMCEECAKSLPRIKGEICLMCGREKKKCTCKSHARYYNGVAAPFYFRDNVRYGVHRFKFRKSLTNSKAFATEMSDTVKKRFKGIEFDYITQVPSSSKSLKKRGFNQCSLLAEDISENTGIPFKDNILKKIYETDDQHGLNFYLRQGNLTGVFDSDFPDLIKDKTVLLCDDISTSGETLNECSKMLWLYGAKEIYCITLALTENQGVK